MTLSKKLKALKNDNALNNYVIDYILADYTTDADIKSYFHDMQNGCQSGFIGELIYTKDAQAFFDKFYEEIEELRTEWENDLGEPVQSHYDLKNDLAWFAWEMTSSRIENNLDIN